jgi:F420-dependent oxidoreductase-like protein
MAPDATLDAQIQQVVDAENDGFDSYWMAQISSLDALTFLALAGQRTNRIELGTAVVPTYPRHPTMLALQAVTAQAATNGRLVLGIGVSHKPVVEGRWGLDFKAPVRHMEQYLTVLRSLLDTGTVDYDGDMFRVSGEIQRVTTDPVSVCIAALAPRMLRLAGEKADGTVTWMVGPKTLETHIVPRITEAAREAGRAAPRVCVAVPICVTDDRRAAMETAAATFRNYRTLPSYRRMLDIEGVESPAEVAIIGAEAEVEGQLRALADAGATDFLAHSFDAGDGSTGRTRDLLKGLVGRI